MTISFETETMQWIGDRLGPVIAEIDGDEFYSCLIGFLREIAACDSVVALAYHRDQSPRVLFEALAPRDREALQGSYFDGAYLLSPFYLRWLDDREAVGLYRLRDIVPEGFFDSIYYTDYYLGSGLRDEVAYLAPIDSDRSVLLALGRTADLRPFSQAELSALACVKRLVASCVARHFTLAMTPGRRRLSRQLSEHLSNFGRHVLTEQEQRVAQLLLRGHSSKSCARELAISPTTERVHRRHIYAKLKISSQAELFNRFFESLTLEPEPPRMKIISP